MITTVFECSTTDRHPETRCDQTLTWGSRRGISLGWILTVRLSLSICVSFLLIACRPPSSPTERRVVGSWSWKYIEGFGRTILTADHKIRLGFPPDDKDGRKIGDDEFEFVWEGTWRLDGEVLVTELSNKPLTTRMQRLDPNNRPELEQKIERRKIVRFDDDRIVFDNGSSLERVRR